MPEEGPNIDVRAGRGAPWGSAIELTTEGNFFNIDVRAIRYISPEKSSQIDDNSC
jgi:hypothetical protein